MNPGRARAMAVEPTQVESILELISAPMQEVESFLKESLCFDSAPVDDLVRHVSRYGGKRLRPALLLLSAELTGKVLPAHVTLGAIVELIHTATLLHDDVLDQATVRRKVPTLNAVHDNHVPILLGDIVYARAFSLANHLDDQTASRLLARITSLICIGEIEQNAAKGRLDLNLQEYFRIIERKTAVLYAASARLGAHYAGAGPLECEAVAEYGRLLGVAFQIADDCLDLVGSERAAGKSLSTDLEGGKMTLPLIHLWQRLADEGRRELRAIFEDRMLKNRRAALMERFDLAEDLAHAQEVAQSHAQAAVQCLAPFGPSQIKEALAFVARFAIDRSF